MHIVNHPCRTSCFEQRLKQGLNAFGHLWLHSCVALLDQLAVWGKVVEGRVAPIPLTVHKLIRLLPGSLGVASGFLNFLFGECA
jgi:hypothetical protein